MIGNTPLIKIKYKYNANIDYIYVKVEYYNPTGSIKDRMVNYILDKAKQNKTLKEHMPIIEATSGNTGIAIASYGARYGHPVYIFMPDFVEKLEEKVDKTGLVPCFAGNQYWNFYEWKEGLAGEEYFTENPPYECPLNAFVSDSFYCFARLCDAVRPELSEHYDALHTKLNRHIHEAFFDAERNVYLPRLNDRQRPLHAFTQALAIYVGATPETVKPAVAENMQVNRISEECYDVILGNLIDDKEVQDCVGYEKYDLVCANILAEILVAMTPVIPATMKKGAYYVTSGILKEKEEVVKEAIVKAGLAIEEVTYQGDWCSITARKK